ncbi:TIM barrel protein [Clostridium sp. P21]|uniref:TIM barrel protein n=1 Tax=Clostridium muellerianum TaxID=2716538 RepID=A0A7Y0ELL7_9CLOT|nr:TIM barrel protein [Clostridium muellerianum]NMM65677.1 TIM barrel protein [Clostridium muellerianum]
MDSLLFGISGIPIGDGTKKFNYESGIIYLKSIGLDSMELPFVRSVNVTDKNKDKILNAKVDNDFYLSAHGSYYINLNADEKEKQEQSIERILKGAEGLLKVKGRSLIFHPGFYLKDSKEKTLNTIKSNLIKLPYLGVDYRLETTGKGSQFGDLKELVCLCKEIDHCKLCIDFSHIHARFNGILKDYSSFESILKYIEDELGRAALEDIHIHLSGINYTEKGERNHVPLEESDFNYIACLKALKNFNVKGCIICESPILEKDSLLLKDTYNNL